AYAPHPCFFSGGFVCQGTALEGETAMTVLNHHFRTKASNITTAELRERLAEPDLTIIDVRPLSAYNGWRLTGEARGGHIPGALPFPNAWLRSLEESEIQRLLNAKGIGRDATVVVYGAGASDATGLAARISESGHDAVRVYRSGWTEWSADESLAIERLANFE